MKNVERHLIVRPFVGRENGSAEKKKQEREKVIGQCGAAIYLFGDQDRNGIDGISGVMEEFEIARQKHKVIIPISYPGMVSEVIWKQVKENITYYPYLEGKIDLLIHACPLDKLSQLIVQILDSIFIAK